MLGFWVLTSKTLHLKCNPWHASENKTRADCNFTEIFSLHYFRLLFPIALAFEYE